MIYWLASYPRSGNTLVRLILHHCFDEVTHSIYDDKHDIGADARTIDIVGHEKLPDGFNIETVRKSKSIFFIKTHEIYDSKFDSDKVIYVVRDFRDVAVSYYNYYQQYNPKEEKKLDDIIKGNTFGGNWSDHVQSWMTSNHNNILFLKFENILDNIDETIDLISNFICKVATNRKIPEFSDLNSINPKFFTTGKKGTWKSVLDSKELSSLYYLHSKVLKDLKYIDHIDKDQQIKYLEQELRTSKKKLLEEFNLLDAQNKDLNERLIRNQKIVVAQKSELLKIRNVLSQKKEENIQFQESNARKKRDTILVNERILAIKSKSDKLREINGNLQYEIDELQFMSKELEDTNNIYLDSFYNLLIEKHWDKIKKQLNYKEGVRQTLVLTTQKVASTSVTHSLRKNDIPNIDKLHEFEFIHEFEKSLFKRDKIPIWRIRQHYFLKSLDKDNCRYITLVREPIARAISHFFYEKRELDVSELDNLKCNDKLMNEFLGFFKSSNKLSWFEDIFYPFTGIDVYNDSFDKDKGYSITKHNNNDLMIIRVETSKETKTEAIKNFFNIDEFCLENRNEGDKSNYKIAYNEFKNKIKFDKKFLDEVYSSKYVKHFYSDEEILEFKNRWGTNSQDETVSGVIQLQNPIISSEISEEKRYNKIIDYHLNDLKKNSNYSEGVRNTIVFSPPKTASQTLYYTLINNGIPNSLKLHSYEISKNNKQYYYDTDQSQLSEAQLRVLWSRKHFDPSKDRIITNIREPIARTLSHFFFNMREKSIQEIKSNGSFNQLKSDFHEFYEKQNMLLWIENKFTPIIKYNIFDHEFDKKRGYSFYKNGNADLMVLKVEIDNEMKINALNKFLKRDDIVLENRNSGSEKIYSKLYSDFKSKVTFDKDFLDEVYSSKYVRHFYTEEEIAGFKRRWGGKIT